MKKAKAMDAVRKVSVMALSACMLATAASPLLHVSASALMQENNGNYYLDYNSFEEAKTAAEELNITLSEEGSVMLKNDGTLPLTGKETVSVFGAIEDQLQNNTQVSDSVAVAFQKAGFKANMVLDSFYKGHNRQDSVIHAEPTFTKKVENSFDLYNDLAVIVIGRGGAEMNDLDGVIKEKEEETYLGEKQGWEHKDLYEGSDDDYTKQDSALGDGSTTKEVYKHKHELELSDSEQALVKYVESKNFKHIVFVINSSSAMETYNIEHDEKINAVIWVGRTGETGIHALPRIINGLVTPSGKVVDEWYKDFTADPTWVNFGDMQQQFGFSASVTYHDWLTGNDGQKATQYPDNYLYPDGKNTSDLIAPRYNGFNGTDAEEDIYIGYKFVETYYQDIYNGKQAIPEGYSDISKEEAAQKWFEDTVTHPFGQGLSYTDFSININEAYVDEAKTVTLQEAAEHPEDFSSQEGKEQKYKSIYVDVTVKNVGAKYSGKEVVQIYANAPYIDGGIEKPAMRLIGFGKTRELAPSASQKMTIKVEVQDMASFDYNDANGNGFQGYELDEGEYKLYAADSSHVDLATIEKNNTDAQDVYTFTLGGEKAVTQLLDDFSGNEVTPKFSGTDGYNSIRDNSAQGGELTVNKSNDAKMTMLSRSEEKGGFAGTYPETPTKEDMTFSASFIKKLLINTRFDPDLISDNDGTNSLYTDEGAEWAEKVNVPETWTQAEKTNEGLNKVLLAEMAGLDYTDDKTLLKEGDPFYEAGKPKTQADAWIEFMNQLSWDEIKLVVEDGNFHTAKIPSIDKEAGSDQDRPNMLAGTHNWCDEVVIASTWNQELAKQEGIITANMGIYYGHTGWYGPGMNIHRSPFSGRNNDYYSQDGILSGYMAAAVVSGAQSRGLNCFIKHYAFNDQDVTRNGMVYFVWGSEQYLRENALQAFQKAMQEGGAAAAMSGFARIAGEACNVNYRLETGIARDEWGYKGIFITDAQPGSKATASSDLMIRTGNDLMLRNNDTKDNYNAWYLSGTWDPTLRGGKGGVMVGQENLSFVYKDHTIFADDAELKAKFTSNGKTVESETQYYYARTCAMRILYMCANSNMAKNGVNAAEWKKGKTLNAERGIAASGLSVALSAAEKGNAESVTYQIVEGRLPEGLTLNASTGAIEGRATACGGEYSFTVRAMADSWVKNEAQFKLTLTDNIVFSEVEAKAGEEYYNFIDTAQTLTEANGYNGAITYTVVSGELPAGLVLNENGEIEGTPEKAGTYTFTVRTTAVITSGSGFFATTSSYDFDTECTIVVTAGELGYEENVPYIGGNGNWFVNGKDTGVKAQGETGPMGEQGPKGDKGEQGEQGPKGDTGATGQNGADGQNGTDGGCGGVIGGSAAILAAMTLGGAAILLGKKHKKDE